MKNVVAIAAGIGPLLLAAHGGAQEIPSWSQLPAGTMTTVPSKTPGFVAAKESTSGFVVAAPYGFDGAVFVVPDTKSVKMLREGGERTRSTCYAVDNGGETEWSESTDSAAPLFRRSEDRSGGTRAVHSERVVEKDGAFTLEVADAFVDPATRGARTIAKTKIPLALVGKAIGGVRVLAARDERKSGPSYVTFIVTAPEVVEPGSVMLVTHADQQTNARAQCAHLRVSLEAPTRTGGDSATVSIGTVLPPLKKRHGDRDELRVRDMSVHLSVSKTARDKEPIVSVSFGWEGRERSVTRGDGDSGVSD